MDEVNWLVGVICELVVDISVEVGSGGIPTSTGPLVPLIGEREMVSFEIV